MTHYRVAIMVFCTLAITGCDSQGDLSHLKTWVAKGAAHAAAHPPHITPIPKIPAYHPVPYTGGPTMLTLPPLPGQKSGPLALPSLPDNQHFSASLVQSPFAGAVAKPVRYHNPFRSFIVVTPQATAIARNTPGNPAAPPLQRYSLSSLTLVGVVKKSSDQQWMAVFVTPKGNVHRAAIGDTLGLRGGQLTKIHYSELGTSFVLVHVPVATVAGKMVTRTVHIDQR
jgi:Tfp pilus assembly protein PilP